jgi:hypothetical protein
MIEGESVDKSSIEVRSRVTASKVILTLAVLGVLAVIAYAGGLFHPMPSELELRSRFFQNQSDFVKLVQMSNQDPRVTLIRSNFTYLDTDASWPRKDIGLSEDRWNEYRQLFRRLNIDGGVTRRMDPVSSVSITVYASGGVLGSAGKGYAYSEQPLMPIVQSVDVMPTALYNKNKGHAVVFEPLAPNWYMFREDF